MAIWFTVLKMIPWKDVIQAAPTIAKSANQLWQNFHKENKPKIAPTAIPDLSQDPVGNLQARVTNLENERRESQAKALEAADLAKAMAEQNQALTEAVDKLRARSRVLIAITVLLSVAVFKLLIWG